MPDAEPRLAVDPGVSAPDHVGTVLRIYAALIGVTREHCWRKWGASTRASDSHPHCMRPRFASTRRTWLLNMSCPGASRWSLSSICRVSISQAEYQPELSIDRPLDRICSFEAFK